mmetsp:Transcript_25073/g.75274  ORF Transcript_25073/g.75274 Transcript_25073/m.75274 type:complete len:220 (+) Transcript_25073:1082-1741(+)
MMATPSVKSKSATIDRPVSGHTVTDGVGVSGPQPSRTTSPRSPTHAQILAGVPMHVDSVPPSLEPPTWCSTSFSARPTAALARLPLPRQPAPEATPEASCAPPDTRTSGVQPMVVAPAPIALKAGSSAALTAATMTGNCFGSAPARTAHAATCQSWQSRMAGGQAPRLSLGSAPPSIASTKARRGATTGSPSAARPQPKPPSSKEATILLVRLHCFRRS